MKPLTAQTRSAVLSPARSTALIDPTGPGADAPPRSIAVEWTWRHTGRRRTKRRRRAAGKVIQSWA